jgi:hypothetical protein
MKKPIIKPIVIIRNPSFIERITNYKHYFYACLPGCLLLACLIFLNTGARIKVAEMEERYNTSCVWVSYAEGVECNKELVSYTTTKGEYIVF